jgi:16S rRNA (adenine1518-N6/adenine1519-N6)-dimethyltransferase
MRKHEIHPRKSLGQNFLLDPVILTHIVQFAEVNSQVEVLEIGAGLGSLTRALAMSARSVTAVELDHSLISALNEAVSPFQNVKILQGDILEIPLDELGLHSGYYVVANIPYYITSAVIRYLLETPCPPARILLTIQREVAERICSRPPDMSLLALSVQVYGNPIICGKIPAGAFHPPPNVDSAIVRIDLLPEPQIAANKIDLFFRLIKAGFSQKRKTLRNSLSAGMHLSGEQTGVLLKASGIDPMRRAETLTIEEWDQIIGNYPVKKI